MAISPELIAAAEQLIGLHFTPAERDLMRNGLDKLLENYAQLRSVALANDVPPALRFDPQPVPLSAPPKAESRVTSANDPVSSAAPADFEQLAFAPVTQLAALIRTRQISSTALTEMYLRRLKRYDPALRCVVSLTEELALMQAHRADEELAAGHYRGPLHGIPIFPSMRLHLSSSPRRRRRSMS